MDNKSVDQKADIFDDLDSEFARINHLLSALTDAQWESESAAPGWSMADTVVHLAQTTEAVVSTLRQGTDLRNQTDGKLDEWVADWVDSERVPGPVALQRWRSAANQSMQALRSADPAASFRWAAAPLRPKTLATTRLAEHWAHMLDICGPLQIPYPDEDRLRHIAWLGHATLPYAFGLHDQTPQPVRVELVGPTGVTHCFGPSDADSVIRGSLGEFCRVGAQRLSPDEAQLELVGPHASFALSVLRNYAA